MPLAIREQGRLAFQPALKHFVVIITFPVGSTKSQGCHTLQTNKQSSLMIDGWLSCSLKVWKKAYHFQQTVHRVERLLHIFYCMTLAKQSET